MASVRAATPARASWYTDLPPNSWRVLLFAGMGWMFDVYDTFVLSLTIPALVAAFALSKADAGAIGSILAGGLEPTTDQCEAAIEAGVQACDRYYQCFNFVLWSGRTAKEALDTALFETVGEA